MGACYSKKASGGNRSYTTVHMASTKLEEASRLARPTPYTRTQNANIDYAAKKGIPLATKFNSFNTVDHGDIKNMKNSFQSNIPRFSSSLPATTSVYAEHKTSDTNCNENEALHVVNNNSVVNSRSASNVSNVLPTSVNKLVVKAESQIKPKSVGSKSCPDKITSHDSGEVSRTPGKGTGLPRQFIGKSSHSVSHINTDIAVPKSSLSKESRGTCGKSSSVGQSPISKSPSRKGFESRDSLSDFDSGLGNSINDKTKPEDSDTIKDLEHLELQEDSSPTSSGNGYPVRSAGTPKTPQAKTVRAPTYKREPNGKWSFDEKHFGPETERVQEPKAFDNSGDKSPRDKHSFKMNASESIFSTYASYKGLLSYQKKSFKPIDTNVSYKDKVNLCERSLKTPPQNSPNVSGIPKIRKQVNQPFTGRSSVFYVQNESDKPINSEPENFLKNGEKSPEKSHDSKHSSLDSDEKSDSTETGVTSPASEVENREFLIDDEISDQPGLTFFGDPKSEESDVQSLQMAVSELHALQLASSNKRRTDSVGSYSSRKSRTNDHRDSLILGSDLGSSCSSIASDDLMLDYEKSFDGFPEGTVNEGPASPMKKILESEDDKIVPLRTDRKVEFDEKNRKRLHRRSSGSLANSTEKPEWRHRTVSLPLRPPRQMSVSEADDGSLKLDASSYRLLCQDLNGVKTLLLRLKSVIQEAETINPFDQANPKNIFYQSLVHNDFPSSFISLDSDADDGKKIDASAITQENADLRRQLVLLQQQLEEKDHTIHLLQQQMTKYLNFQCDSNREGTNVNAATQTERGRSLTGSLSSSSSSADDSIETLVSVQDDFEKSFRKNSEEQDLLTEHLKEVARLLDHKSLPSHSTESEC